MRQKLFRNYLLTGVVVMLVCCGSLIGLLFRYYEKRMFDQLSIEAGYISNGMMISGEEYLQSLNVKDRITWIDSDGRVLFDSQADPAEMDNHLDREEIAQAGSSGHGQSIHYSQTKLEHTLYYARKLEDGTYIRVSCNQSSVEAMLLMLLPPMLMIMLAVFAVCSFIAARLSNKIVDPINHIDLDDPRVDEEYSELAPLVTRIRQQNNTIGKQMEELSRTQKELSAITENMSEGFLLLDQNSNVLSGNQTALRVLEEGSDRPVKNLKRDGGRRFLTEAAHIAFAGEHNERVVKVDGRYWQVIANPVVGNGQVVGVAVLLLDVTEKEQREELRREFSANVSHELKTPLTSISGFAELMMEGMVPFEKCREFSRDIYKQSQRLIELVNDIIRLSRLDEGSDVFELEDVDLYRLSEEIAESLNAEAEKKNVRVSVSGEHAVVHGVWQIINEMVYNLCDNAIKYNKEGGSVVLSIGRNQGRSCITVSDTGIGIPYVDQERVFERFYRVDKSHSREIGGTGLGLSIVKHGAQYHDARIELKSVPGKGTDITVIF